MSLNFKVYLQEPNGKEVIRRICIPGLDYACLRHEICYRFSISVHDDFSLCWKDSEGDEIRISSDKDMEIALSETSTSPVKLYVTLQGKQAFNHPKDCLINNGPIHSTVTCDECQQGPLKGYRYKCLVCHNYDLCTNCEKSERIHSEHPMIRIPVPLDSKNPFGRKYQNVKDNIYGNLKCLLENV